MYGHGKPNSIPRKYRSAALATAVGFLCLSCGGLLKQSDLQEFVETGETNVLLRSASFSAGGGSLDRIPSASAITCSIVLVNPKSFDVAYSLAWNIDGSLFESAPSAAPKPSDSTHISFSFALSDPLAEHKTIVFSLGKYVASINKTYPPETFSVICDSPPDAAARLSAVTNPSDQKSVLAILLPNKPSDDDLAKLRISWTEEGTSSTSSSTYDISSLKSAPSPNPFSGTYNCYFQPSDIVPGYGYSYSIVVIDQAGQESGASSVTSTPNLFPLNYDGNGATGGSPPATASYHLGDTVAVAGLGSLVRSQYVFSRWNTAANGSGTDYSPGASLNGASGMPASEVTLYAQWYTTGITISFDLGTYGIVFQDGGISLAGNALAVASGTQISVSCASAALTQGGTGWAWYLDGNTANPIGASSTLSYAPIASGEHIISCTVTYNGIMYSGYFLLMVTN